MNRKPTASILPTFDVVGFKPAPVVAYFSSRGPGGLTEAILKVSMRVQKKKKVVLRQSHIYGTLDLNKRVPSDIKTGKYG